MTALKTRTSSNANKEAKKCWDAIGEVILGRADNARGKDMHYQSGTSFNDFKAAFRSK